MKALLLLLLTISFSHAQSFLPENDLFVPVGEENPQIDETKFNQVIDELEVLYRPLFAAAGGSLKVTRDWKSGTSNAYARRENNFWEIIILGGLARNKAVTPDGLSLIVCHELGHHLGGAPHYNGLDNDWATYEGQADYYSTLKCLRLLWEMSDNQKAIKDLIIPDALKSACREAWTRDADYYLCLRSGMAGLSIAEFFKSSRWTLKKPRFETPETKVVKKTYAGHPGFQCRLDTYLQGAICQVPHSVQMRSDSEIAGTCHQKLGHNKGLRPNCWYKFLD